MIRDKKGSTVITTPLVIALGLIIVSVLIVLCVNIITPFIWYEKLSSTSIKYVYVMEEYGYLTNKEAGLLKDELTKQGFDISRLNIKYTNNKVSYGEPIFLEISYLYDIKIPLMKLQSINMNINRTSVSKR